MNTKAIARVGSLAFALTLCSVFAFGQYSGGSGSGFSVSSFCGSDLNGSSSPAIVLGAVQGASTFCTGGSDVYSVNITNGTTATSFAWSLPTGATILFTLNTPTSSIVSVNFGTATTGNISVIASNSCSSTTSANLPVANTACNNYLGGADDGFSNASFCAADLNGSASLGITLSSIVGSSSFCSQGSDVYSISLTSGVANSILWSVPSGASVTYAVNRPTSSVVTISFGSTSGNISVTASNSCSSVTSSILSVTNTTCNNYLGGSDDGFSNAVFCGSNLTGGSLGTISLGPITGSANYCFNYSQMYSVNVLSGIATSFSWSAPTGGSILSNLNQSSSSLAGINFGSTDGNVQVTATNGCTSATVSLAVTGGTCNLTLGGSNDGFSTAIFCGTDLTGGALGPITLASISGGASPYCINLGQNYSVNTSSGFATSFVWSVTGGGSSISTLSTTTSSTSSISFPAASGTIQVDATNGCFSDTQTLAVSGQACDTTLGGNDDGFGTAVFCGTNLNSSTSVGPVTLAPISGINYCINLGQSYTVTASAGNPNSFVWSVTLGSGNTASQISSFNSSNASILLSSASATIQVTASNNCFSDTQSLSLTGSNCNITLGGNDDGFTTGIFCGTNLTGGILAPITLSGIIGTSSFCYNYGQNYSVNVTSGSASSYAWSGPTGAGAYSQINSPTSSLASINFVGTDGNVAVSASNGCSTAVATLAVTGSNCNTTLGGNNDGFSTLSFCGSDLTGGTLPAVTLGSITGPSTFCYNLGDNYSVTATGTPTGYVWNGPAGSSITSSISSFTGSTSTFTFGGSNGTISVTASNACNSATQTLALSGVNCLMSLGGANDGFSVAQVLNTPLPVTLTLFTAKAVDTGVKLDWITETEINNSHFDIERSKDGKSFIPLGAVDGAGNSKMRINYTFLDKQPYKGISYYRLKQVDFDGKFEYSPTVSVEFGGSTQSFDAVLYPNPTNGNPNFNIRFNTDFEGAEVTMLIQDLTGRDVLKKTFTATEYTQVKSSEEALKPGVYIVTIQVAEKKIINRLVIQ